MKRLWPHPLLLLLLAAPLTPPVRADWVWNETLSPHFVVKHESPWNPPGFTLNIEKMHNRLRMDLAMFSPWMAKERLNLYLYKERETYLRGQFKPPQWSNGLAMYASKTVVVYDQKEDRKKLLEVLAHETTHLLFEGYWGEVDKQPPTWLNEGLAMMEEEASATQPEKTVWFQNMVYWPRDGFVPFQSLFETAPTQDMKNMKENDQRVAGWYVEAYSLVFFLYRVQGRLPFKNFCAKLRDGDPIDSALWTAFRFRTVEKLEKAWIAWLNDPALKRSVERVNVGSKKEAGVSPTAIQFKGFESFRR